MRDYPIHIDYSDEAGGYLANIPDLEGCSAGGTTLEAALQALRAAKASWLEAARAEGRPIPPPSDRPVSYQEATADLRERIRIWQEARGVSGDDAGADVSRLGQERDAGITRAADSVPDPLE